MNRTTIMLPDKLKTRLRKEARHRRISMGELIRESVEKDLGMVPLKQDPLASGSFVINTPGPSDVSSNIDRYLYGSKS